MITEVFFTLYVAGVIYRYVELAADDNDIDVVDLLYPWVLLKRKGA